MPTVEQAEKILKDAVAIYKETIEAEDKARQVALSAAGVYRDSITVQVLEELKKLKWQKIVGRGARTTVHAECPESCTLHKILQPLKDTPHDYYNSWQFGCVHVDLRQEHQGLTRQYQWFVEAQINSLKKSGVTMPCTDRSEAARINKLVKASGLKADELAELIRKK